MGMTVVVVDEHNAPSEVAHPPAFSPVAPKSGQPVGMERLAEGQDFRIEPEKSKHGPVSVLVSAADQRVLVLRNGIEIGRARVTIKDPASPLGTHTFVMRHEPEATQPKWVAVAMPGHFDEAGRVLSQEAASVFAMPEGFAYAVSLLLEPGDTMFVTDAPILEREHASGLHSAERRRSGYLSGDVYPECAADAQGSTPNALASSALPGSKNE